MEERRRGNKRTFFSESKTMASQYAFDKKKNKKSQNEKKTILTSFNFFRPIDYNQIMTSVAIILGHIINKNGDILNQEFTNQSQTPISIDP